MSRTDPQFNLRIPEALRDKVMDASKENKRSATAEILARLESTFVRDDHSGEFRMEGGFEEAPDSLGHLVNNHIPPSKQSEVLSKELSDLLDEKIGQMEQRLTDLLNTPRKSD